MSTQTITISASKPDFSVPRESLRFDSEACPKTTSDVSLEGQKQICLLEGSLPPGALTLFYQQMAQAALLEQQKEDENRGVALLENQLRALKLSTKTAISTAVRRAAEHEAVLQGRLEALNRTHEETIARIQAQIEATNREHQTEVALLEARMNSMAQTNQIAAAALKTTIENMHRAHQEAIERLQQEITLATQQHNQTVSTLQTRLTSTTQEYETKTATLLKAHRISESRLQSQVTVLMKEADTLKKKLYQEEQTNLENENKNRWLEFDYIQLENKYEKLKQDNDQTCIVS